MRKNCTVCGLEFEAKTSERTCSVNCRLDRSRAKGRAKWRARHHRHRAISPLVSTCIICGAVREVKTRPPLTCCTLCRSQYMRQKAASRRRAFSSDDYAANRKYSRAYEQRISERKWLLQIEELTNEAL